MNTKHTLGPWRWEYASNRKALELVGGKPEFDLTVMSFSRRGMNGATANFRDTEIDGMNLMHRIHEREDWIKPFHGREHHANWCAGIIHPDACLIAAAPDLLAVCKELAEVDLTATGQDFGSMVLRARLAIAKATGETQ